VKRQFPELMPPYNYGLVHRATAACFCWFHVMTIRDYPHSKTVMVRTGTTVIQWLKKS